MNHIALRRRLFIIALLLIVASALTGCELRARKSPRIAGDFSQALRVGTGNIHEPYAIHVAPDGSHLWLAWPEAGPESMGLHLLRMGSDGETSVDQRVDLPLFFPHHYALLPASTDEDGVYLLSLAGAQSEANKSVYLAKVTPEGQIPQAPFPLTPAHHAVQSYAALPGDGGSILLIWESNAPGAAGIYGATWSPSEPTPQPQLLVSGGSMPAAAREPDGTVHLAWALEPAPKDWEFYYARFGTLPGTPLAGTLIGEQSGGTGAVLSPPRLGFDDDHIYLYWSIEYRAGMQQGASSLYFITFPKEAPSTMPIRTLALPEASPMTYTSLPAQLQQMRDAGQLTTTMGRGEERFPTLTQILPLPNQEGLSGFVAYPAPVSAPADIQLLFCSAMSEYRLDSEIQPIVVVFADGEPIGMQLVARTENLSWYTAAAVDDMGNLYVVWPDTRGEGDYDVYLATTAPALKSALNRYSREDILIALVGIGWGMLSGLTTFFPFAVILFLVPTAILVVYHIFGSDDALTERGPRIVLLVAGATYYATKLILLAPLLSSPPLLGLIPPEWIRVLTFVFPILILALALLALWIYIRRAASPRLFMGFFIFAITDALLTMMLYGASFYA